MRFFKMLFYDILFLIALILFFLFGWIIALIAKRDAYKQMNDAERNTRILAMRRVLDGTIRHKI